MGDANSLRLALTPLNEAADTRVHVDERRSGNMGRDGYAVLDQAQKPMPHDTDDFVPWARPSRNRPGLTPKTYSGGPNLDYTE